MKKNKKKGKSLDEDKEKEIKYDDIKYSENVYKTLKKTGFIDTINKVFSDHNNTLVLEGNIKKINVYHIAKKRSYGSYSKCKLFTTWYIKNSYNEILDSIDSEDYSGDFALSFVGYGYNADYQKMYSDHVQKMYADAVDVSYLKLHRNARFTKYLKQESDFAIKDPILNLPKPTITVLEKTDASAASVIVKRKDGGHGSGFAITNDGYIITNYHVIAGKFAGKPTEVKVITYEGQELEATVVRISKFNDLALLKVNKNFEKAFTVSSVKAFKNMQDVYTIGAPKSLELGQSVSAGVISNERKSNNNNLLQLGMSVNGGNSGGPLYDATGKLHGVIVSKLIGQNTEGVSFAIPGYLIEEYLKLKIN
jgi:S1-C subfamily serine protease